MDKLTQEMADGGDAQRLLDSKAYKDSIGKVKEGIIQAMSDSPFGDEKTHNRLVIALQLLAQIEKNIRTVAETGKMAKLQIEQANSLKDRIKQFGARGR